MFRFRRDNLVRWLLAASLLACVQVVIETALAAWRYGAVILPPREFFDTQRYDAFSKLYAYAAPLLGLPHLLDRFVGQGATSKLSLAPELLLMALPTALVVALLPGLFSTLRTRGNSIGKILAWLAIAQVGLHFFTWAENVHLPIEPTIGVILRNFARNFVYDGTAFAVFVTLASAVAARAVARERTGPTLAGTAACIALVLAATITSPAPQAALPEEPPMGTGRAPAQGYNVILISIDSLRADHLGAYGYERRTSPAMDRLAHEGVLFRHTSSTTSWTLPAHMSILTGRSLLGHGVVSDDRRLSDDVPTLAESMKRAGYVTGGIVSAPYLERRFGFDRGFDDYDDKTIEFEDYESSYAGITAPRLQETAAAWLRAHANDRFFLFLHYWDVHYDYDPGPPYDTMFDPDYTGSVDGRNFYFNPAVNAHMDKRDLDHVIALYDGEIRLVDDHIAKLRSVLEGLGIADRTVVVVTADHGDEFFEHGRKGHHRTLYDEVLRVPLILFVPGVRPARQDIETEASVIDIAPTIAALVGAPPLDGAEGRDLSPLAFGAAPDYLRRTFAELYRRKSLNMQAAIRFGPQKVIQHLNRRVVEAYDTQRDPKERQSLPPRAGFVPARLSELRTWLDGRWAVFAGRIRRQGVRSVEMDEKMRDRLRSLGYIQ